MSPERITRAAKEIVDEVTPDYIPTWFKTLLIRVAISTATIVTPLALSALAYGVWGIVSEQQKQRFDNAQLVKDVSTLTTAVANNTTTLRKIVDGDLTDVKQKVNTMEVAGMLPGAKVAIEELRKDINDIKVTLARKAPSDVYEMAEQRFNEQQKQLDKLANIVNQNGG